MIKKFVVYKVGLDDPLITHIVCEPTHPNAARGTKVKDIEIDTDNLKPIIGLSISSQRELLRNNYLEKRTNITVEIKVNNKTS